MQGAPAAHAHADGGNLARPHTARVEPDPPVALQPSRAVESQVAEDLDEQVLEALHVRRGRAEPARPRAAERQDRVADELSGTVVGDVTTPVGAAEFGTGGGGIHQQVRDGGPRTHRDDVGMLEQQQVVAGTVGVQAPLQRPGLVVADPAEPANGQVPGCDHPAGDVAGGAPRGRSATRRRWRRH